MNLDKMKDALNKKENEIGDNQVGTDSTRDNNKGLISELNDEINKCVGIDGRMKVYLEEYEVQYFPC